MLIINTQKYGFRGRSNKHEGLPAKYIRSITILVVLSSMCNQKSICTDCFIGDTKKRLFIDTKSLK